MQTQLKACMGTPRFVAEETTAICFRFAIGDDG
jgi:hypothetical protein